MYIVGKIVNTHGIKGEVKIISLSDFDRFAVNKQLYYEMDGKVYELVIAGKREHKGHLIIKFQNLDNINEVLFLKGFNVFVYDKIADNQDSYYYSELIGLSCYTKDEELIGQVHSIIEVPQGHILEIYHQDKKIMIPFVKAFIKDIDAEKIIIEPIEGLL